MSIDWDEKWDPMSDDEIAVLEAKIGAKIPAEYEAFLRDVHGRTPIRYAIDVADDHDAVLETTADFLCGRGDDVSSIAWAHRNAYDGALAGTIPFAVDGGGNYFVIRPSDGSVHLFFHDRGGSPTMPVAASFSGFLTLLHDDDDHDHDEKRAHLVALVRKIVTVAGTDEEMDEWIDALQRGVPHPEVMGLIYYPEGGEALSPEEIVSRALAYERLRC